MKLKNCMLKKKRLYYTREENGYEKRKKLTEKTCRIKQTILFDCSPCKGS